MYYFSWCVNDVTKHPLMNITFHYCMWDIVEVEWKTVCVWCELAIIKRQAPVRFNEQGRKWNSSSARLKWETRNSACPILKRNTAEYKTDRGREGFFVVFFFLCRRWQQKQRRTSLVLTEWPICELLVMINVLNSINSLVMFWWLKYTNVILEILLFCFGQLPGWKGGKKIQNSF